LAGGIFYFGPGDRNAVELRWRRTLVQGSFNELLSKQIKIEEKNKYNILDFPPP
jgi:hypothetical protein